MDSPLLYLTGLFALGISAQWLAWKLHLPAILLLLVFGFAANWWCDPTEIISDDLLFPVVSLCVAVILFDGGLSLRFGELKSTSHTVIRLVTFGCLLSWILGTLAARLIFTDWSLAALAGAIFTVTGPTVIGPLLRQIRPNSTVSSVAKWEGIVIDPIGALLAVLVATAVAAGSVSQAAIDVVVKIGSTLAISTVFGYLIAYVLIHLFRRHLVPDYLQNPVLLASVLMAYTTSDILQPESGLATVTILGVIMANQKTVSISHLIEFKENLGVLLISVLFILLASRYRFVELLHLGWPAFVYLLILIFIVRPVAVMISTQGTNLSKNERIFLSFLAPRGIVAAAVASVFALEFSHLAVAEHASPQLMADIEKLVPLTFLVIVGTVAFYGLSAGPLARRLGIAEVNPQGILFAGADHLVREIAVAVQNEGYRVLLVDTNHQHVAAARMAGLPTYNASILSEYVREELDLGGLGRFIAMTPNDQINSLAAIEFREVFERAELYQLKPDTPNKQRVAQSFDSKRARYVFAGGTTYFTLNELHDRGFIVKSTKLTEEFNYQMFREKYTPQAVLLFSINEARELTVFTDETDPKPQPGETLLAFVPKQENQT